MTRKWIGTGAVTILVIILFISLGLGVFYLAQINTKLKADNQNMKNNPKHHVLVIVDGYSSVYSDDFKDGLNEVASSNEVAIEYWQIKENNVMDECLRRLKIATVASVDGIIVHAFNNEAFSNAIREAQNKGIPVITLNEDVPSSERISHIGINKTDIGTTVGEYIGKNFREVGHIAVIEKNIYAKTENESLGSEDNRIYQGVSEAIKPYLNLSMETVKYTGEGLLSAEDVTMDILNNHPDVNIIFCADGKDTLGVVQVLTDFNALSNMTVIGYDDLPEVIAYIQNTTGVIDATVVADYKEVGKQAIETLIQYKNGEVISEYISPGIQIIDADNLQAYLQKQKTSDENEANEVH